MTDRRDQALELFAPSGRGTTASAPSSRPARIHAGAGRWSRASHGTAAASSTSRPAPASSPSGCSLEGHRVPGSTRARTCSLSRGAGSVTASSSSRHRQPSSVPRCLVRPLTFTYLLRYVDDRPQPWAELARVVRPGGTIANLEFCDPRGIWRPLWDLYVGVGLPALGRIASKGWYDVGRFLGPSIRGFYERWPLSASSSCGARRASPTCRPGA